MYFGDANRHIVFGEDGPSYNFPDGKQINGLEELKE
jgi:hypothetical protein